MRTGRAAAVMRSPPATDVNSRQHVQQPNEPPGGLRPTPYPRPTFWPEEAHRNNLEHPTTMLALKHLCTNLLLAGSALLAQSLTTTFTTNNNIPTTAELPGFGFDVTVTNPAGVVLHALDLNFSYVGIPGTVDVYTTALGGTYNGTMVNPPPGMWRLRARGPFVTAGAGTAAPVTLDKPIHLAPGTYGMMMVFRYGSARYVGSAANPPAQLIYANADMSITSGATQSQAFVSAPNQPRVPSFTAHYLTPPGDVVDFTADVSSGQSPLTVAFTNESNVTGTILGYEWDFQNDGIVDATTRDATATYSACGDYSVRLRILTSNGPIERIWTNMIAVDPLQADFVAAPNSGAPLLPVQFTDTSTIAATGWFWDFQSDGVIDSTQQNPQFTFGPGCYNVTLIATNGCRTSTVTKRIDSVTDTWSTNFTAATNLIARQALAFFDLVVTSPEALILHGIDTNTVSQRYTPMNIKVWLTEGSASGKQSIASEWREVANGTGFSAGGNQPSVMRLDRPIVLLPGRTHGIAIQYLDAQAYYNSPGNTTLSGPDFQVNFWGVNTATTPFTGAATVRQWNGTLYYTKEGTWPVGSINYFGPGCAGSLGVPGLVPVGQSRPKLGTTTSVGITNLPLSACFMILGFSNTMSSFGPLPLSLTGFGMPGCTARVSADATSFLGGAGNSATFSLFLPNNPVLSGGRFYLQALSLDPLANGFGATMSDASVALASIY